MARAPRPSLKAGRNEGRKLLAGLLNNVATASLLAASLQPVLGVLRQHQTFTPRDTLTSGLLSAVAGVLIFAAQRIVRRLED